MGKYERSERRLKELIFSQLVTTVTFVFTVFVIYFTLIQGKMDVGYLYTSIGVNIIACIYIIRELNLKTTNVTFNDDSENSTFSKGNELYTLGQEKLNELLKHCVEKENYILAAQIRDELKKFKKV